MKKSKKHRRKQIVLLSLLLVVGTVFLLTQKYQINPEINTHLSVLFIGNSYSRPLPKVIQSIARSNGVKITYRSITPGGWTLQKHSKSKETLEAIRERQWDYIVLQEQSQLPSFSEEQRIKEVYPFAEKLVREIRATNATPLLFLTWGRKFGDRQNVPDDTRNKMQTRLLEGYRNMAKITSSQIVPIGLAWEAVSSTDMGVDLYTSDGSHPNQNGVFLSAAVFVSHLIKSPQLNTSNINGISKETAELLLQQAGSLKFKQ
ncbi:DUF4886 domain-containing protein [Microbulbifer epialgicus]|uniref:DUF4886 domain-containing protein n=1 Tax=Microbulbifer epialgicus TaxID=393907 RepID=A0ABV4NZG8_9GAMM